MQRTKIENEKEKKERIIIWILIYLFTGRGYIECRTILDSRGTLEEQERTRTSIPLQRRIVHWQGEETGEGERKGERERKGEGERQERRTRER